MSFDFNSKKVNFLTVTTIGLLTFVYLIKSGTGILFSLFLLIPSTFFAVLVYLAVVELVIEPILKPIVKWLRR
jgi:hypothetical protein